MVEPRPSLAELLAGAAEVAGEARVRAWLLKLAAGERAAGEVIVKEEPTPAVACGK